MNASGILAAVNAGEDKDWEFKSAKGGLPGSLWETYSAMANTDGGVVVLGVKQQDDKFVVEDLPNPQKLKQDFWNNVNNRQKISQNLLRNEDVTIEIVDGNQVIVCCIPRAARSQRPIYTGQNPLEGTFRRYQEGDYKCTPDEVGRMLADQAEEPADSRLLENFGMGDLDEESLRQYRNRFSARNSNHPWLNLDEKGLLEKLGGWRKDRATNKEGLTVAGLLMFGKDEEIRDPSAVSQYQVDYRERMSNEPQVRWTDRLTVDGMWVANVFQFYQRVFTKLTADLKVPFEIEGSFPTDPLRKGFSAVHEAIQEALVNALIHADYRGMGGIVIDKYPDRIEMSNPGSLLVSYDQLLQGGISECRNKSLQQMFQHIGAGDKAGSGIDKIVQGWKSQHWRPPSIQEKTRPDRVELVLPMFSLIQPESLERLRKLFGKRVDALQQLEVQILVTAEIEGEVSNARIRLFSDQHPSDLTRMLQGLVSKGFLVRDRQGRWSIYRLPSSSAQTGDDSTQIGSNSTQTQVQTPPIADGDSAQSEFGPELLAIAQPAREKSKLQADQMSTIILKLCQGRFLTPRQLGGLTNRKPIGLQQNYLRDLTQQGKLQLRYPNEPNHPDQAYTTKE